MRPSFSPLPLLAALLVCGIPTVCSELPDPDDLVGRARVISLDDKTLTTFKVSGVLQPDPAVQLRFIVAGCQTRGITVRLEDARDGSPILVSAGGTAVLYDPISAETIVFPSQVNFQMGMEAKEEDGQTEHDFVFRLNLQSLETATPESTCIDIPSMLAAVLPPLQVQPAEGGGYLLTGESRRGNRLSVRIVPGRKEGAVARVGLFGKDAPPDQPMLELSEILLNPTLPDALFQIPEAELADSGLPLKRLENSGSLTTILSLGRVIRALIFRMALVGGVDEKIKTELEVTAGRKLDWEALRKADQEAARKLKAVFADKPATSKP